MKGLSKTKFPSVYYYDSEERRFDGKPDTCFYFTYNEKVPGKTPGITKWAKRWVKVGWRSEKITAAYAAEKRSDLVNQIRNGEIPYHAARKTRELSYAEGYAIFKEVWFPNLKNNGADLELRYRTHTGPKFGQMTLDQITPLELESYKTELLQKKFAAATVRLILGDMRNVYNKLKRWGKYKGDNPFEQVQMPKVDNARTRFLNQQEADKLLTAINARSRQMFLIATVSLNTGARLGEILGTTIHDLHMENRVWHIKGKTGRRTITLNDSAYNAFAEALSIREKVVLFPNKLVDTATAALISKETGLFPSDISYVHLECVDMERGVITYRRRNSGKFNTYRITKAVRPIFEECIATRSSDWVFPSREGTLMMSSSTASYDKAVADCKLNPKGTSSLDKVVFHTLRHTYCSWEAQKGTPLFKIARLVGHKTTAMTERYSHLCPQTESQILINQDAAAGQLHSIVSALVANGAETVPQAVLDWLGKKATATATA